MEMNDGITPSIPDIVVNTRNKESPVRPIRTIVNQNTGSRYTNRIMVGTPTTGLVRMEWHAARTGQIIPMNWSMMLVNQFIGSYIPIGYMVADAQNLIVAAAMESDVEWLLFIEHDVIIPPDAFVRFNQYMNDEKVPVVSGLYFTRSRPSDPLVFRGTGTSTYTDWDLGDLVWVDGVPTGCLLIHMGIIREMWGDSEEYQLGNQMVKKIFETPRDGWIDPDAPFNWIHTSGTSDLAWCRRVMEGGYFKKAGWDEYQEKEFPFLIDTNIFCRHINPDGEQFP